MTLDEGRAMRVIDLEAHFCTQKYIEYLYSRREMPREDLDGNIVRLWYSDELCSSRSLNLEARLLDLGKARLLDMDAVGIDMQVISLTSPSVQLFEASDGIAWARQVNDELSKAV